MVGRYRWSASSPSRRSPCRCAWRHRCQRLDRFGALAFGGKRFVATPGRYAESSERVAVVYGLDARNTQRRDGEAQRGTEICESGNHLKSAQEQDVYAAAEPAPIKSNAWMSSILTFITWCLGCRIETNRQSPTSAAAIPYLRRQ